MPPLNVRLPFTIRRPLALLTTLVTREPVGAMLTLPTTVAEPVPIEMMPLLTTLAAETVPVIRTVPVDAIDTSCAPTIELPGFVTNSPDCTLTVSTFETPPTAIV